MSELIQRYLDGELSVEEAQALREAIARDPEMDAELRDWERMLHAAADTGSRALSPDFTDRVMRTTADHGRRLRLSVPRLLAAPWRSRLAWAAALLATFALGVMLGRTGIRPVGPAETREAGAPNIQGELPTTAARSDRGEMRVVRMVYAPHDPTVRKVQVTGTFNDWDAQGIALKREGDVWTAVLVLPRGTYEYMFVEDNTRWVTDPLALQTRDDGFGNRNAVLDLTL